MLEQEIEFLQDQWASAENDDDDKLLREYLGSHASELDPFDKIQLFLVIRTCQASKTLSAAGRTLFSAS